jgi:tripartite-type tricarboxylate transporter receptor subunit TctC
MSMRRIAALGVVVVSLLTGCGQTATTGGGGGGDDLKGETVDFVVPFEPGGGYDIYARLVAPALEKCTGATVVVRNEPGAGGLVATSKTFVAKPTDLRLQIVNTVGVVSSQIAKAEGARFELEKFSWLGRVSAEPNVLVVAANSRFRTFDDILASTDPVRFVATGPGSNEYINSSILPKVYGFPSRVITGFAGSGEARAAVLAGKADAHILPLDSQLDAIQSGDVRPLLVIGPKPSSEAVTGTPAIADHPPRDPAQQAIVDALVALADTGRAVVAPPGVDDGRLARLRAGLDCALKDPELAKAAARQQRPIVPLSGTDTAKLVSTVLASPQAFQQLVRDAS